MSFQGQFEWIVSTIPNLYYCTHESKFEYFLDKSETGICLMRCSPILSYQLLSKSYVSHHKSLICKKKIHHTRSYK